MVHPTDDESYLHTAIKGAIQRLCQLTLCGLPKNGWLQSSGFNLRKLTDELKEMELSLKSSLYPDVRKCVQSRNIALFDHIFTTAGFLRHGFCGPSETESPLLDIALFDHFLQQLEF